MSINYWLDSTKICIWSIQFFLVRLESFINSIRPYLFTLTFTEICLLLYLYPAIVTQYDLKEALGNTLTIQVLADSETLFNSIISNPLTTEKKTCKTCQGSKRSVQRWVYRWYNMDKKETQCNRSYVENCYFPIIRNR